MAAFLILLLFPIWGSPRFWVGFVIHFVIHGCALAHSHRFIHYQVFGLCLSKAECLPCSWSNAGTYGKNIELYIFQELLLSTFLYGVTSSKILTTFCFLFKDKYFLSFYMLHAAFQKHAGEFETPAVSFQDLFEDPWAMYSLFSSWVAAGSVLNADSKRTVSSLSVSPKSTWGWLTSHLWQLGHPSPTMVKACDIFVTVSDKNSHYSIPVRCTSMLKSSKGKHEQNEKMHSYAICSQTLDKNYTGEVEIITAGLFYE